MGQKYYARARAATLASCVFAIFATACAYADPYEFDGSLPGVSDLPTGVTDPAQWTGTVSIKNVTVTDFNVNSYGNESSTVRLSNVTGWLRAPGNYAFTNMVPVELVGTLTLNNGNSANDYNPNRCTVFKKLSGGGYIYATGDGAKTVVVIQDASEFTGNIGLNNKLIVFGDTMPSYNDNNKFEGMTGSIWVMEGASVTANPPSENWWAVGGMKVYGELRTPNLGKIGGGTYITTFDAGKVTLTSTGNGTEGETDTDYARISGTGTLKYEGSGWRALSTNNFPTAMTLENEQAGDILLSRALTYAIGSLSGSKNFQGNYGSGGRRLRVLQAKDTEWSGSIIYDWDDRFKELIVAPGVSGAGTLTLSGYNTNKTTALTVETGAKVKLTGAWQGATTVAGTLGGTGTITGDLTLSGGATLNVVDVNNPLKVTGNFSATGTIEVHLPAGADLSHLKTLLSVTGTIDIDSATFLVAEVGGEPQNPADYSVKKGKKRLYVMGHHGNRVIFR